jgi:hypothetical protein
MPIGVALRQEQPPEDGVRGLLPCSAFFQHLRVPVAQVSQGAPGRTCRAGLQPRPPRGNAVGRPRVGGKSCGSHAIEQRFEGGFHIICDNYATHNWD